MSAPVSSTNEPRSTRSPLHQPAPHESGHRHTSGEAIYVDDMILPNMLVAQAIVSPHAHAKLLRKDAAAARGVPGVHAILFAEDIPGENQVGPVIHDEPLFAEREVLSEGQAIGVVIADSYEACRAALAKVEIDYEVLPALLGAKAALAARSFSSDAHVMRRGDVDAALLAAPVRISGEFENGGQEHFYLESQCSLVGSSRVDLQACKLEYSIVSPK